ncbi:hypothetical protein C9374_009542 [Naegleria lovaniensis]|uniref:Uncharacterized protein n=1 Tax=Naegleria lovaniensis TaxID=51637 RepID=A0AA88KX06_NAELO|nr:uncharacterized protein C9374_009542 [Naegleria lovaniensis]KAG2392965.1 hypothetical protein C9374_009542 [Naegleria lovaniensis]
MLQNRGLEEDFMSDEIDFFVDTLENTSSTTMNDESPSCCMDFSNDGSSIKRKRDSNEHDYLIAELKNQDENYRKTKNRICPNYSSSLISREESQQKRQIVEMILSKKRFENKRKLPPQHELYHNLLRDTHLIGELEVQNRMICKLEVLLLKLDEKNSSSTMIDGQQIMTFKQLVQHIASITSNISLKEVAEKVLSKLAK